MKKQQKTILIGIVLAVAVFLFYTQSQPKETSLEINAYVLKDGEIISLQESSSKPLSIVTLPAQSPIQGTQVILESVLTAGSGINTVDVHVVAINAINSPGTNVYGPAINGYNKEFTLSPGETNIQSSAPIDTSQIELGDVDFSISVQGYYLDAQGLQVPFSVDSEPYTINIVPEEYVQFRTSSLSYGSNGASEIAYGSSCDNTELTRYTSTTSGGYTADYCDDIFDIILGVPCDKTYSGNPESCYLGLLNGEYSVCWRDEGIGIGYTKYELGGSNVDVDPYYNSLATEIECGDCVCGDWVDGSCGAGSCASDKILQTRVCTPEGCGIESRCVSDISCQEPVLQTCSELGGQVCTAQQDCIGGSYQDSSDSTLCCVGGTCTDPPLKTVVFRSSVTGCTVGDWSGGFDRWIAFDSDNDAGNSLTGVGQTSTSTSGTKNNDDYPWITTYGGTAPCGYSLDSYSGDIYVSNVGGTSTDVKFTYSKFNDAGGGPIHLSNQPCCGAGCGTCCERYDDGTSNC